MSGIPSWAVVGAKVVCTANDWERHPMSGLTPEPAVNEVCLVDEVDVVGGECFLRIVGYPSDFFGVFGFKPLISQADDLAAHFDQLLQIPHRIEEKA